MTEVEILNCGSEFNMEIFELVGSARLLASTLLNRRPFRRVLRMYLWNEQGCLTPAINPELMAIS